MNTATLSPVLQHTGPFASVLVDVSQDTGGGRHEHDLRTREACQSLARQGAPPAVVEAVTQRLDEIVHRPAPTARFIVATPDEVVLDEIAPLRVDRTIATWDVLPDLAPWISHRDASVCFVLAVVDHEGGDVSLYDSDVPDPELQFAAGGEVQYVQHVPMGDWASLQFQRTSENVWKRNAEAVVDEVATLVRDGTPLVLLAGDPTSVGLVRQGLEEHVAQAEVVQLPTGQRARDGGDEAMWQAVRETLMDRAVQRRLGFVHELKARRGRDGAVATGLDEVADAFVEGKVETLLLDPEPARATYVDPDEHPGLDLGPLVHGRIRADEALIAAAAMTGAEVAPLPASVMGGSPVAALLRWS